MHATFTAKELLYATSSFLKSGDIDDSSGRVTWELDEVKAGDWFIAIPSEFEDPHDHLDAAVRRGARGVIVNRRSRYSSAPAGTTIIAVPDTRTALLDLARYWRYCVSPKVVGVSGSHGRRATMLMLRQLLQETHRSHLAFMGNLGWYGCLKEVLSMPRETEVLIFEAGTIGRGDISRIGGALDPDLAVLTQIRHPLPTPERDAFAASLYCELLETLAVHPEERLSAIIYDDNIAVQRRLKELLDSSTVLRHSVLGDGFAKRLPERSFQQLSEAMEATIGRSLTRAELWCAIESAKALGVSQEILEGLFEIDGEPAEGETTKQAV